MAAAPSILLDAFGNPLSRPKRQAVPTRAMKLRFDAVQTTRHNEKRFVNADTLGPISYLSPGVRAEARRRARYEYQNSTFCFGMVTSLADDTIGTGPRLQIEADEPDDADDAETVERLFHEWGEEVDFAGKLHTMRGSKAVDGEAFALLGTNYNIESPVKLDFRPIEAEMIGSPTLAANSRQMADGIILDDFGNRSAYVVLRRHPGDSAFGFGSDFDFVPAREVIHLYDRLRPGQLRGICEFISAIPLFEDLRRYADAVLAAAETAADHAAIFETTNQPGDDDEEPEAFDEIELEKRLGLFLPKGWKASQMKAEQPTTTFDAFEACIIRRIARCLQMPFHVAAGDASKYNYSSARLDDKSYFKRIRNQRELIRRIGLTRLFRRWWEEARLIPGLLPARFRALTKPPAHLWRWDGEEHIDPTKDAGGDEINLRINATTLAEIYAKKGLNWEKSMRQRAREIALMKSLGLIETAPAPTAPVQQISEDQATDDAEPDEQEDDVE